MASYESSSPCRLKEPNKKIPVHTQEEKGLTRITQNTVILGILELLIH